MAVYFTLENPHQTLVTFGFDSYIVPLAYYSVETLWRGTITAWHDVPVSLFQRSAKNFERGNRVDLHPHAKTLDVTLVSSKLVRRSAT